MLVCSILSVGDTGYVVVVETITASLTVTAHVVSRDIVLEAVTSRCVMLVTAVSKVMVVRTVVWGAVVLGRGIED